LTVPEAAEVLGISGDAVRSRIKRKTLATVREGGRVYVVVGGADRPIAQAQPTEGPGERDKLVDEMRERIRYLERQLERADERDRENRRIIVALTSRIPAIEAPQDAEREPEGVEPRSYSPGAQEGARRPWWRRVFGG
jgi:hypothetical protein